METMQTQIRLHVCSGQYLRCLLFTLHLLDAFSNERIVSLNYKVYMVFPKM